MQALSLYRFVVVKLADALGWGLWAGSVAVEEIQSATSFLNPCNVCVPVFPPTLLPAKEQCLLQVRSRWTR